MKYLTETDWAEFQRKFPAATNFLTLRNLQNELKYLRSCQRLTDWQANRLQELEAWELMGQVLKPEQQQYHELLRCSLQNA